MKKFLMIAAHLILCTAPIFAEESDQKPDKEIVFKKWDYFPEYDLIIFGDDVNLYISKETIRYRSTENIEIKVDETRKDTIVQGFGADKDRLFYKKICILTPALEEKTKIENRLATFKARRTDYIAAQNSETIRIVEVLPITWVDYSIPRSMVYFGIRQGGANPEVRGCSVNHVTVRLRDDGMDYAAIEYIDSNTRTPYTLDLSITILVPTEKDVMVWREALNEWSKEGANWLATLYDPGRLLPTDRVSTSSKEVKHMRVNLNENQKFTLNNLNSFQLLSGVLEINAHWHPTISYVPIDGVSIEELKPEDVNSQNGQNQEAWVAFFEKDADYPTDHYKKAVIYAKPEVLERYRAQIEIYRRACEEYKEKVRNK